MRKPEMILFDYGNTLVYEPAFDCAAGFRAVLSLCTANPRAVTAEALDGLYREALDRLLEASRRADCDFMDMAAKRRIYESLGLRFSADLTVLERVFWDAAGPGTPMPGVSELLGELAAKGIRRAVVSNMNFREESVRGRIDRLLPDNGFEFVLCSCEYATRKPRGDFFALALEKAGLPAGSVWYCGDNPRCDVLGAHAAGLLPVWYDNDLVCPYRSEADRVQIDVPCLHIREWGELSAVLGGLD